jgi:UDP-N-acetylmuramate dehydrogenase
VISLRRFESDQIFLAENGSLKVSSGTGLARLSEFCKEKGLSGAEFICHIPGTIGGAVAMNAGFARKGMPWRQMRDIVKNISVYDTLTGSIVKIDSENIGFEYRKTKLPETSIILEIELCLKISSPEFVRREIDENFKYRNSVQDLRFPSAGSIFKNPTTSSMTSGQLLDKAGMKGVRIGNAMVSEQHANFFLNVGNATSQDMLELIEMGRKKVSEQFGIQLELEIKVLTNGN